MFTLASHVDYPIADYNEIDRVGDIDAILRPSLQDLRYLAICKPKDILETYRAGKIESRFPVIRYLAKHANDKYSDPIMRTLQERSEVMDIRILPADDELHIACWMRKNLPYKTADGVPMIEAMDWFEMPAHTHAKTIVLAHRRKTKTLEEAFDIIVESNPTTIDVDAECISFLERRMFEVSHRAGKASHYVWGRSLGAHEGDWNPWLNTKESWIKSSDCPSEDRKVSDD